VLSNLFVRFSNVCLLYPLTDLTPEVKKIILDLSNESYSGHKISQVVGVIPRIVNKFIKRVRERRKGRKPSETRQTEKNGHIR
jgi:transposase-like protein